MSRILRASSLPTYQDCQRMFAAKTIPDLIAAAGLGEMTRRTSYAAEVGTAVHAVLARMLEVKRDTGETEYIPPTDEMIAEFEAAVETAEPDPTTPGIKTAKEQIDMMSRVFAWSLLPRLKPLYIEQHLRADLGDDFELSGHVDLIETNGVVSDHKTSKKKTPSSFHSQLGAYTILARTNLPDLEIADVARINGIQRVNPKNGQPDPVIVDYDRADCEDVAWSVIDEAKDKILKFSESGDIALFLPNPSSNLCSKTYCDAWGTPACTYGKKE